MKNFKKEKEIIPMKNYDTTFIMDTEPLYKHFLTNIQLLEAFLSNLLSEKAEEGNRNYGGQGFKQYIEKNKNLYKYFNVKDRDEDNYGTITIKIGKNGKYEKAYLDILNKYLIRKNFIYNFYIVIYSIFWWISIFIVGGCKNGIYNK